MDNFLISLIFFDIQICNEDCWGIFMLSNVKSLFNEMIYGQDWKAEDMCKVSEE